MTQGPNTDSVVPFILVTRYTPRQVADLFFTKHHDVPLEQPSWFKRSFAFVTHKGLDIRAEADGLNAVRHALRRRGFKEHQVSSFVDTANHGVKTALNSYAQSLRGPHADLLSLDLYYNQDFFLGVKLNGERLDATPWQADRFRAAVETAMFQRHERLPGTFQIGQPTLGQQASGRFAAGMRPRL